MLNITSGLPSRFPGKVVRETEREERGREQRHVSFVHRQIASHYKIYVHASETRSIDRQAVTHLRSCEVTVGRSSEFSQGGINFPAGLADVYTFLSISIV